MKTRYVQDVPFMTGDMEHFLPVPMWTPAIRARARYHIKQQRWSWWAWLTEASGWVTIKTLELTEQELLNLHNQMIGESNGKDRTESRHVLAGGCHAERASS